MPSVDRAIVHLPSIFACYWCSDFLLFFSKTKRFNSILWHTCHYYLYIYCILKLLWTIQYFFFLLEFLEISCLSNLNCYYLLLMRVGVASLYNVFILCNCHYLFVIVFIKIFLNKLNVKTQPIGTLFFVDPNSHTHP